MKKKNSAILMLIVLSMLVLVLHQVLHSATPVKETITAGQENHYEAENAHHSSMSLFSGLLLRMVQ